MKNNSLKVNMGLNTIKNIMSVFFPLITFPYISKILEVERIGIYTFSCSVIDLFCLFGMLGTTSYAIREGSMLKNDRIKLGEFANQVFSISVCSSLLTYAVFLILLFFVPKFQSCYIVLLVLSVYIVLTPLSVEWLFSIEEDYLYITLRSIMFQIISLVLMFAFVKTQNDLLIYVGITAFSKTAICLSGFIYSHKYLRIKLTRKIELARHIKPILIIFSSALASTIYVSSDVVILGFLSNDYHVGIYSVSAKIYKIIRIVMSSVLVVSIPRLSAHLGNNQIEMFEKTADSIMSTLVTFLLPTIVGLAVLAKEAVLIVSSGNYLDAVIPLEILCGALLFCMLAWFYGQCILLPNKQEKVILIATSTSAIVNVVLNFILIPVFQEKAAAITTLISECVAMLICGYHARCYLKNKESIRVTFKVLAGCIAIIVCVCVLKSIMNFGLLINTFIEIVCAVGLFFIVELVLKNTVVEDLFKSIMNVSKLKKS